MSNEFTPEQSSALSDFEKACANQDLHAFGNGRCYRANEWLALAYDKVLALGLSSALTASEHSSGKNAKIHIS